MKKLTCNQINCTILSVLLITTTLFIYTKVLAEQTLDDVRMLTVMERYNGIAETIIHSINASIQNQAENTASYNRYINFGLQRLTNYQDELSKIPINTPFIWANRSYLKSSDGNLYNISPYKLESYFKTSLGVLSVDESGICLFFQYATHKFIQIDLEGLENRYLRLHKLSNSRLGLSSTRQASSAGGERAELLVVDLSNYTSNLVDPNYQKDDISIYFQDACHNYLSEQNYGNGEFYYVDSLLHETCKDTIIERMVPQTFEFPKVIPEDEFWYVDTSNVSPTVERFSTPSIASLLNSLQKPDEKLRDILEYYNEMSLSQQLIVHNEGYAITYETAEGHYGMRHFILIDKNRNFINYINLYVMGDNGSIKFSDNKQYVLIRDIQYMDSNSINLYDLRTGADISPAHTPPLRPFLPEVDGSSFFTVSRDYYHLDAFNITGSKFCVIDDFGVTWLYEKHLENNFTFTEYLDGGKAKGKAETVKFIGDNRLLIAYNSGIVALYDTDTKYFIWLTQLFPPHIQAKLKENWSTYCRTYLSNDNTILVIERDGLIKMIDVESGSNLTDVFDAKQFITSKNITGKSDIIIENIEVENNGTISLFVRAEDQTKGFVIKRKAPKIPEPQFLGPILLNRTGYNLVKNQKIKILPNSVGPF